MVTTDNSSTNRTLTCDEIDHDDDDRAQEELSRRYAAHARARLQQRRLRRTVRSVFVFVLSF
jgi:hypothetical protein